MLAYLDPASGSLVLQFIIGSAIGISVFCRRTIARFLGTFKPSSQD